MNIEVDDKLFSEYEYMAQLLSEDDEDNVNSDDNAQEIIKAVLTSVANGSRRPGSWERQMLEMMGLVASDNEHHVYRSSYGKPSDDSLEDDINN